MKQDTDDWYDKAQIMKEEALEALTVEISRIAEYYIEKYDISQEELTKSILKNERNSEGSTVSTTLIYNYKVNKEDIEWVMLKESVIGEKEKKNYLTTEYLNEFLYTAGKAVDLIEKEYEEIEEIKSNEEFKEKVEELESFVQNERMNTDMEDVKKMIRNGEIDQMLTMMGKNDDYKDYIWKFMTYWEDDEMKQTEPEFLTENNNRLAIRAERKYEGEKHVVGFVLGIDDTPDRFFIHRLQNPRGGKLQDEDHQWTDEEVREMMGFDHDLHPDTAYYDVSNGVRFRVQGDLRLVKSDYNTQVEKEIVQNLIKKFGQDYMSEAMGEKMYLKVSQGDFEIKKRRSKKPTTDELKDIQEKAGIEEEKIREYQERDGIKALHPSRRKEYIEEVLKENIVYDKKEKYQKIKEEVEEEITNTQKAVGVVGNHLVIVQEAGISTTTRDNQFIVMVPEDTNIMILHDEHNPKKFKLPRGHYTFDFLDRNTAEELTQLF